MSLHPAHGAVSQPGFRGHSPYYDAVCAVKTYCMLKQRFTLD